MPRDRESVTHKYLYELLHEAQSTSLSAYYRAFISLSYHLLCTLQITIIFDGG